jgi:hypothetical protein
MSTAGRFARSLVPVVSQEENAPFGGAEGGPERVCGRLRAYGTV